VREILVIGAGVAGVETALTLSRGLPDDHVTLLAHSDVLHVIPDLLYVPTGVDVRRIEVPLHELLVLDHIDVVPGILESVDMREHVVVTDIETRRFDVIVAAPGAEPLDEAGLQMHTPRQAEQVRDKLDELFAAAASDDERGSIVIRAEADDAWAPPAYELAVLLAARRRLVEVEDLVTVSLVTGEMSPFQWFEPRVADLVVEALVEWGIELSTGVPSSRIDHLAGDVTIDFPRMHARTLPGLPGRDSDGWYDVDVDGRVHPDAFVVGDASRHGFKSAFAVAWEARQVLRALGGDLDLLGAEAGSVPIDCVEHQLDLGTRTLKVRLPVTARLRDPWLGHDGSVVVSDEPPDRLAGLLVSDLLQRGGGMSAARAHRALITRRVSQPPQAGRVRA
jgi:hypothetical protein